MDSQIRSGLVPPASCKNGCARWSNLAQDGNTKDQNSVNAMWSQGSIPQDVGNNCAQPLNNTGDGPWCYCAGTNDDSWGYCQNRDSSASVCKSAPNGLNSVFSNLNECRSSTEENRISTLVSKNFNAKQDIENIKMIIQDSLILGDTMFGTSGHAQIVQQVKDRNTDLQIKKDTLTSNIKNSEAIIERTDRDFIDTRETLPDSLPSKRLNVIEDYTLAFISITYLFALIAMMYWYCYTQGLAIRSIGESIVGGSTITLILFALFYFLA